MFNRRDDSSAHAREGFVSRQIGLDDEKKISDQKINFFLSTIGADLSFNFGRIIHECWLGKDLEGSGCSLSVIISQHLSGGH
jgi:hypothetical protein